MNLNRIGEYKGYEVFTVSKYDFNKDDAEGDVMYIVKEDNEIVLNGQVVASVNLKTMTVNEYPRSERRTYRFPKRTSVPTGPSPAAGKRREVVTVEEVMRSVVVDPTPMDDVIDKFLADARNATVETYIEVLDIDIEAMKMA